MNPTRKTICGLDLEFIPIMEKGFRYFAVHLENHQFYLVRNETGEWVIQGAQSQWIQDLQSSLQEFADHLDKQQ